MAFAKGNKAASHDKPWTRALMKHFAQNPDKLAKLAESTADLALAGDQHARKEVAERLDGKPLQQIEMSGSLTTSTAEEMTDDQLAAIAAGSSKEAASTAPGTETVN